MEPHTPPSRGLRATAESAAPDDPAGGAAGATAALGAAGAEPHLLTLTDAWLWIYKGERPHDSLGRVPPLTFPPRPSAAGQSPLELST